VTPITIIKKRKLNGQHEGESAKVVTGSGTVTAITSVKKKRITLTGQYERESAQFRSEAGTVTSIASPSGVVFAIQYVHNIQAMLLHCM